MGENPFRLLPLVAATFPKGTASVVAASFAALPKASPWGSWQARQGLTEGVLLKKALTPPNTTYVQI